MTLKEDIEGMIDKFQRKVDEDPGLREELAGIRKRVSIDLGRERYSFILEEGRVHSFTEDLIENPDIVVISDPETMRGLISKRIKPMKALALRKLKVKGDMEDLLRFRKFF